MERVRARLDDRVYDSAVAFRRTTAAILASLTSTCRRHTVDPQQYFMQLLMNLPKVRKSELPMCLPDQWNLPQAGRITSLQNTPSPIS